MRLSRILLALVTLLQFTRNTASSGVLIPNSIDNTLPSDFIEKSNESFINQYDSTTSIQESEIYKQLHHDMKQLLDPSVDYDESPNRYYAKTEEERNQFGFRVSDKELKAEFEKAKYYFANNPNEIKLKKSVTREGKQRENIDNNEDLKHSFWRVEEEGSERIIATANPAITERKSGISGEIKFGVDEEGVVYVYKKFFSETFPIRGRKENRYLSQDKIVSEHRIGHTVGFAVGNLIERSSSKDPKKYSFFSYYWGQPIHELEFKLSDDDLLRVEIELSLDLVKLYQKYGVIHLDAHPNNTVLNPQTGRISLIDFSMCKAFRKVADANSDRMLSGLTVIHRWRSSRFLHLEKHKVLNRFLSELDDSTALSDFEMTSTLILLKENFLTEENIREEVDKLKKAGTSFQKQIITMYMNKGTREDYEDILKLKPVVTLSKTELDNNLDNSIEASSYLNEVYTGLENLDLKGQLKKYKNSFLNHYNQLKERESIRKEVNYFLTRIMAVMNLGVFIDVILKVGNNYFNTKKTVKETRERVIRSELEIKPSESQQSSMTIPSSAENSEPKNGPDSQRKSLDKAPELNSSPTILPVVESMQEGTGSQEVFVESSTSAAPNALPTEKLEQRNADFNSQTNPLKEPLEPTYSQYYEQIELLWNQFEEAIKQEEVITSLSPVIHQKLMDVCAIFNQTKAVFINPTKNGLIVFKNNFIESLDAIKNDLNDFIKEKETDIPKQKIFDELNKGIEKLVRILKQFVASIISYLTFFKTYSWVKEWKSKSAENKSASFFNSQLNNIKIVGDIEEKLNLLKEGLDSLIQEESNQQVKQII